MLRKKRNHLGNLMRLDRVESLLKQEVAQIIQRRLLSEKHGLGCLQSMKLSADLSFATIYFSVLGNESQKKEASIILNKSVHFIKKELGSVVTLKTIPNLRFKFDPSVEHGFNMVEKIKQLN